MISDFEQNHSKTDELHDAFGGPGNRQDITIKKPRGATTIVMNTASYGLNVPSESRQHEVLQHKQVPSDIASGPLEAPKQPRVKFPSCSLGRGRQQTFNPKWY